MDFPSAENCGSVSIATLFEMRFKPLPSALIKYTCVLLSRDKETANLDPSGDQEGALLFPFSFDRTMRLPVANSWI